MRKSLQIVALALLLITWGLTAYAVFGPNPLPARIPTHFNAAGQADGWGTPPMLWLMPAVATAIYLLMSLVARYPAAFNFPLRTTPAARRQLEAIGLGLVAWLRAEVVGLFAWIQYETIQFAHRGQGTLSPVFLPAVLIVVFGTIAWHMTAMRRAARSIARSR